MRQCLPSILFTAGMVILYFLGSSPMCVTVGTHNACWGKDSNVTSEFCPSGTSCFALESDQKYNAYVSTLNVACDEAKAGSYGNAALNSAIKAAASDFLDRKSTRLNSSHMSISYAV